MACHPTTFTLVGTSTIDDGIDSSRLLPRLRAGLFRYTPTHSSTAEAFKNSLNSVAGRANIIGWGKQAIIYTGAGGQSTATKDQFISAGNVPTWNMTYPKAVAKHSVTELTLCSCDTGAGSDGARLLQSLAILVGVPVTAPTGLVFFDPSCQELYLEAGAHWQTATKDSLPEPIEQPKPYKATTPKRQIQLMDPDMVTRNVTSVDFRPIADHRFPLPPSWAAEDVTQVLAFVDSMRPYFAGGLAMACTTGLVTINFDRDGTGSSGSRVFQVLNNRLLQDSEHEEIYYYFNQEDLSKSL